MLRCIRAFAVFALLLLVSACIAPTSYIDPTLPAASAIDVRPAKRPTPVQLIFEFRTHGSPNMTVTPRIQAQMLDIARQSALFSKVSTDPAQGGRRLVVTINNFGDSNQGSAFVTGATLGLVGTQVTDRYLCEARYDSPGRESISFSYEHALISTIGAGPAPRGLTPYPVTTAATKVFDQLGWSIMRDLAARGATEE